VFKLKVEDDIHGLLLGEENLMKIMQNKYKKRVTRIEKDSEGFKVFFDPSEDINAFILGMEDISKLLRDHYKQPVITVGLLEHEEYLVRFRK